MVLRRGELRIGLFTPAAVVSVGQSCLGSGRLTSWQQ